MFLSTVTKGFTATVLEYKKNVSRTLNYYYYYRNHKK